MDKESLAWWARITIYAVLIVVLLRLDGRIYERPFDWTKDPAGRLVFHTHELYTKEQWDELERYTTAATMQRLVELAPLLQSGDSVRLHYQQVNEDLILGLIAVRPAGNAILLHLVRQEDGWVITTVEVDDGRGGRPWWMWYPYGANWITLRQ